MSCLETATTRCSPSTLAVLVAKRCALITRSFCSLGAFCCPLRSSLCFMAFKLSFLPSYFPACNHSASVQKRTAPEMNASHSHLNLNMLYCSRHAWRAFLSTGRRSLSEKHARCKQELNLWTRTKQNVSPGRSV